jgi:hypothetical protein
MDLSDRRARTSPLLGVARTVTDWCRLLRTRPAALALWQDSLRFHQWKGASNFRSPPTGQVFLMNLLRHPNVERLEIAESAQPGEPRCELRARPLPGA